MKYYNINQFINEIININENVIKVNVIYSIPDSKEDKYGKTITYPLIIILETKDGEKIKWTKEDINKNINEKTALVLSKNPYNGEIGVCTINAKQEYSQKFNSYYHERTFSLPSSKTIKTALEEREKYMKQYEPVIFDI